MAKIERPCLSAEEIAKLVAEKLELDVEEMSYQWQVDENGVFSGVVIL